MKKTLLILTQKVDRNDPVLGFFHTWIERLSTHYSEITVICLEQGEYALPENIRIFSLGKEKRKSRLQYILRFYTYLWRERYRYENVFVHMNQEYVLLGGLLWRLLGKRVALWRNHPRGTLRTSIAVFLSDKVMCTSAFSFTARFAKTIHMPAGIDTDIFVPDEKTIPDIGSILSLGRMSNVKRTKEIVDSVVQARVHTKDIHLSVYGTAKDNEYDSDVRESAKPLLSEDCVHFYGSVVPQKTPDIFRRHQLFINLTEQGSMDKTVLEAMACGTLVITSNESFADGYLQLDRALFLQHTGLSHDVANAIVQVLLLPRERLNDAREKGRAYVVEKHSLTALVDRLTELV